MCGCSKLAALVGTALLTASPVGAQPTPARAINVQTGEPVQLGGEKNYRFGFRQVLADPVPGVTNQNTVTETLTDLITTQGLLAARVHDQADETLGATLQPVGDVLRAQLDLPTGQGLLIASLRTDGPSAQAGLKQNDILLSLADQPLAAAEDVTKQLRAAGDAPLSLKVLRGGKPVTLQVRPHYRVTLGPVREQKTEYFIGVSIETADDALRAQLELPAGQGVVVNEVTAGSPADKAGVKKHDVLLELAGNPVDSPETLSRQVQATRDQPTTLKLLRGGKPVTIPVTPAVRKVAAPTDQSIQLWLIDRPDAPAALYQRAYQWQLAGRPHINVGVPAVPPDLLQRLDRLEKELKALRRIEDVQKELKAVQDALEKVNTTLKSGPQPKRD